MCTVIIANHHHKEFPLVIAANRDEDLHRASSPVQILTRDPHLIIGGKDNVKGGSWLGVNKESIFVAITNQDNKDPKLESRGNIVIEALKRKTINELLTFVEELNPTKYNKFNLIFGNQKEVYMAHSYILHSMVIREVPHGIHVITNDMKFAGETPKAHYVHQKLDSVTASPWLSYYKTLKKVLANSDSGVKVRPRKNKEGKFSGHCTRSSSILAFSEEGLVRYKFHDRTGYKPRKSEDDPFVPRYKDYIDLWRNPDNKPELKQTISEDDGPDVDEVEEISENTKAKVIEKFKNLKKSEKKSVSDLKARLLESAKRDLRDQIYEEDKFFFEDDD
jgi:uncharacterized protein with NRDE domain